MRNFRDEAISMLYSSQVVGLGLYMARRKLFALGSNAGITVNASMPYLSVVPSFISLALIAFLNLHYGWVPSRKITIASGIICSCGVALTSFGGPISSICSIVVSFAYPIILIYYCLTIVALPKKIQLPSIIVAILVNLIFCAGVILLLGEDCLPVLVALPIVIAVLLTRDKGAQIPETAEPKGDRETHKAGLAILLSIVIGYVMCSILNGLMPDDYFSLSSKSTLLTYVVSGVIIIALLFVIQKLHISTLDSLLTHTWPLMLVVLVIGIVNFSSILPVDENTAIAFSFTSLNLFYFISWAVCPLVIARYKLPTVPTYAVLSIICTGYIWRQLGRYLSGLGLTFFSVNLFGLITTFIILLLLVIAAYRKIQNELGQSSDCTVTPAERLKKDASSITDSEKLSDREKEVITLSLKGYSASRIAKKLFISESTVRFHLQNTYRKLGIHSKQELLDLIEKAASADISIS